MRLPVLLIISAIVCGVLAFFTASHLASDIQIILMVQFATMAVAFLALARISAEVRTILRTSKRLADGAGSTPLRWRLFGRVMNDTTEFMAAAKTAGLKLGMKAGSPMLVQATGQITIFIDGQPGYFQNRAALDEFLANKGAT